MVIRAEKGQVKMLVEGANLEELRKYRGIRKEQIEKDRKLAAEQNERASEADKEKKKSDGSDPVGSPGPVTA